MGQSNPGKVTSIAGIIEGASQGAAFGLQKWGAASSASKSTIFAETISTKLPFSAQTLGKAAPILNGIGKAVGFVGLANTAYQLANGNISTTRALTDGIAGVLGMYGGPYGAAVSIVYFGALAFAENYYNDGNPLF